MSKIIVRMAPSPTGLLHVGTARTTLFNWLFAKKEAGTFILRMEDTDTTRSTREFEADIIAGLKWLGLTYDDFYRQSERTEVYTGYLEKMIAEGTAYVSQENAEEGKRAEVIRLKNPGKDIVFTDLLRGDITFNTTELGDFVIAKSVTEPLYHFAVVADDFAMGVTHIIRGEDGISNTPRQILIQEALGAPRPLYTHVPFILAPDRSKLSKRHGAVSVLEYKKEGILPEALINFLALLGWHPEGEEEIFSREELIKIFDLSRVQKGGAIFDREKLLWINKEHLKRKTTEEQYALLLEWLPDSFKKHVKTLGDESPERGMLFTQLVFERVTTLGEITKAAEDNEYEWLTAPRTYSKTLLLGKKGEIDSETVQNTLHEAKKLFEETVSLDTPEKVKAHIWQTAETLGRANFLWPLRIALSGMERSPDPFVLVAILGIPETISRLEKALVLLKEESHV